MDETCKLVGEFHQAFDCHIALTPSTPELTNTEAAEIKRVALCMQALAQECWVNAARAGDRGRPSQLAWVRLQLLQEELGELAQALADGDVVEALDALCDLQYVVDGAFHSFGLATVKLPAFRAVHDSNMSKLGQDGKPIINAAGRVVKGPGYFRPKLAPLVAEE